METVAANMDIVEAQALTAGQDANRLLELAEYLQALR